MPAHSAKKLGEPIRTHERRSARAKRRETAPSISDLTAEAARITNLSEKADQGPQMQKTAQIKQLVAAGPVAATQRQMIDRYLNGSEIDTSSTAQAVWETVSQDQSTTAPDRREKPAGVLGDTALDQESPSSAPPTAQAKNRLGASASSDRTGTIQRYTQIDLDEKQKWDSVKQHFTAFKPTISSSDHSNQPETLSMVYAEGPPLTSRLNVSDGGRLAIHGSADVQHTVFFAARDLVTQSNANLETVRSGFRLERTGVSVIVHNHPARGRDVVLQQVKAAPANGDRQWAIDLETRCDIFHKNITGMKTSWDTLWSTPRGEGHRASPELKSQQNIDEQLTQLKAGDAFLIKAKQDANLRVQGWNEHYAGIVAVDGADSVTLENYNRDPEATDLLDSALLDTTEESLFELNMEASNALSDLKKEREGMWFWQSKKDVDSKISMAKKRIEALSALARRIGTRTVATHYFKMYGPASKRQSFLDQWKNAMQGEEGSTLKLHKGTKTRTDE